MTESTRRMLAAVAFTVLVVTIGFGGAWLVSRSLTAPVPERGSPEWVDWQRGRYLEISAASDPSPRNLAIARCTFDTLLDDNGPLGIHLLMRAIEAQHAGAEYMPVGTHMITAPLLDVSVHCTREVDAGRG